LVSGAGRDETAGEARRRVERCSCVMKDVWGYARRTCSLGQKRSDDLRHLHLACGTARQRDGHRAWERRTGLNATSLAFVAGVAYCSVRAAGCGYRCSVGSGRPDEMLGFTAGELGRVVDNEHNSPARVASMDIVSTQLSYLHAVLLTDFLPESLPCQLSTLISRPCSSSLTCGARWYFVWSADIGLFSAAALAALRNIVVARVMMMDARRAG